MFLSNIDLDFDFFQPKNSEEPEPVISLVKDSEQSVHPAKHVNKIVIGSDPNDIQEYLAAKEKKSAIKRIDTYEKQFIEIKKPKTEDSLTNGETYEDSKLEIHSTASGEDQSSDTDSGVESEKKICLDDSPQIGRGQELESSDTDSWGTPANSPAKGRQPSFPPLSFFYCTSLLWTMETFISDELYYFEFYHLSMDDSMQLLN